MIDTSKPRKDQTPAPEVVLFSMNEATKSATLINNTNSAAVKTATAETLIQSVLFIVPRRKKSAEIQRPRRGEVSPLEV
jgi:hypothetical protein